jgi:hypothetical protein
VSFSINTHETQVPGIIVNTDFSAGIDKPSTLSDVSPNLGY